MLLKIDKKFESISRNIDYKRKSGYDRRRKANTVKRKINEFRLRKVRIKARRLYKFIK